MKMWKHVQDDGMNITTYTVLAETAEQAAEKLNHSWKLASVKKAEDFTEVKTGIYITYADRWPQA